MDLFDFNGDGKKDLGEEWIEYQIMEDCMKDFDAYQKRRVPKNTGKPNGKKGLPTGGNVYGGCAIQLLGAIIFIPTLSTLGGVGLALLLVFIIVGGLVVTQG